MVDKPQPDNDYEI